MHSRSEPPSSDGDVCWLVSLLHCTEGNFEGSS